MQKVLPLILVGLGGFFLLITILGGWVVFPLLINNKISSQVRLEEGSITWHKWKNIVTPIFIKYYLFNVTNPNQIVHGEKPILEEIGPYVYEQKRAKTIHSINNEEDTVTYQQSITYFFRPDLSGGRSDQDVFTIVNLPLAGLTSTPLLARPIANEAVQANKETLFILRSVDEFLFKGYFQPFVRDLSNKLGRELLPNNMMGLYYGKNGTLGSFFEVGRGIKDQNDFGWVHSFRNQTSLNWWGGKYCNMLNGTDGSIFPPFVTRDRTLKIFSEELCRSLYLTYQKDIEHHGIPGFRFSLPKELLQRAEDNEDNRCFCENIGVKDAATLEKLEEAQQESEEDEWGDPFGDDFFGSSNEVTKKAPPTEPPKSSTPKNCKAGVILLSACRGGKPVVASTPHFLYGEESDVENVIGIKPVEALHETYIDLEINTGLVLEASKKIQINVNLVKTKTVHQMGKLQGTFTLPILWADEFATMPPQGAEIFKAKLLNVYEKVNIGKWVIIAISGILVIIGIIVFIIRAKKTKYLA